MRNGSIIKWNRLEAIDSDEYSIWIDGEKSWLLESSIEWNQLDIIDRTKPIEWNQVDIIDRNHEIDWIGCRQMELIGAINSDASSRRRWGGKI